MKMGTAKGNLLQCAAHQKLLLYDTMYSSLRETGSVDMTVSAGSDFVKFEK
jgi:hypothetical protein